MPFESTKSTPVHQPSRRCGGRVAALGARAVVGAMPAIGFISARSPEEIGEPMSRFEFLSFRTAWAHFDIMWRDCSAQTRPSVRAD
jgi:hypothetical protein